MRREYTIKVHENNDMAIIEIQGDMSASAASDMDTAQQEVSSYSSSKIAVKFDGRSRINSAGIAILINLVMDSRDQGHKVYLTGMSDHFRKIFQLVGLTRYAEIVASEEDIQA